MSTTESQVAGVVEAKSKKERNFKDASHPQQTFLVCPFPVEYQDGGA
jgi:hypothetical protein